MPVCLALFLELLAVPDDICSLIFTALYAVFDCWIRLIQECVELISLSRP